MADLAPPLLTLPSPATFAARPSPVTDRLPRAMARMAGRLADSLARLGDVAGADFLREQAAVAIGSDPPDRGSLDGSCLELPSGPRQPIDRVVQGLRLDPTDGDLLVLALLAHQHEGTAALLRSLHPTGEPWPTLGLAARLADEQAIAGLAGREDLLTAATTSRLLAIGALLIVGDGPFPDRTLRPAPRLWEALSGLDGWPDGVLPDDRPAPPWGLDGWFAERAVQAASAAVDDDAAVTIVAASTRPAPLASRLVALVERTGRVPSVLRTNRLDAGTAQHLVLLCLARGTVPVVSVVVPDDDRPAPALHLAVPDVAVPLLLSVPEIDVVAWPRPVLQVPTAPLARADRLAGLRAALPELEDLDDPIGPASIEPTEVALAVADVRARAARSGTLAVDELRHHLRETVDARTEGAVPIGAQLVHPRAGWPDLILPEDRRRQLVEAVERQHAHDVVLDQWRFLEGRTGARGLRLLFCGPPGTGKTLAAEVVASALGRDLLVVDLSRLVSKWIGETEKNLAAVFDAAERGGAALLFDEADALFGRRTEVGDARDRYANLETAYLLSRLERFDGVAMLATNLRQNLDSAFARRLEFIVPFDLPDAEARSAIWRRHLPAAAPLDTGIDLTELAALYELPGALIRNAAVAAAFLAATAASAGSSPPDAVITLAHLVHAVRREYVKAGQAFPGPPPGLATRLTQKGPPDGDNH